MEEFPNIKPKQDVIEYVYTQGKKLMPIDTDLDREKRIEIEQRYQIADLNSVIESLKLARAIELGTTRVVDRYYGPGNLNSMD